MAVQAIAEVVRRRHDMTARNDPGTTDEIAIERLFTAATGDDPLSCGAVARDLLSAGVLPIQICEVYIPEVARRMGDGWKDDTMSFSAVTIGAARLQYLLREVGQNEGDDRRWNNDGEQASVLLLARQSDHTLRIMVLAGKLRRRGYSVRVSLGDSVEAVIETIRTHRFDAIFLSAGTDESIPALADLVAGIRDAVAALPPVVLGGIAVDRGGQDVRGLTGVDLVTSDIDAALQHCGLNRSIRAII